MIEVLPIKTTSMKEILAPHLKDFGDFMMQHVRQYDSRGRDVSNEFWHREV